MTEPSLFSAGFAWQGDDEEVSQTVATPDATPQGVENTAKATPAAHSVASVASVAFYLNQETAGDECREPDATPPATPKTAEIRHSQPDPVASVATVKPVATVATWPEGVALMRGSLAPIGIAGRTWKTLIRDAEQILSLWGSDLEALGWSTLDVFGVARTPGARRVDVLGLLPLLDGRAVLDLSADHAVIQATPRDQTRFYRRLRASGGVPVWAWLSGDVL